MGNTGTEKWAGGHPLSNPLLLERMSWVGVVKSEAFDSGLFSNEYFIESIHRRACTHTVFCNRALSGKNVYRGGRGKDIT